MKHSRFFRSVLLISHIGVVIAVFACDDLKAIRDAAQTAFEAAEKVYQGALLRQGMARGAQTPSPPPITTPSVPSDLGSSLGSDTLKQQVADAKKPRDKAKIARDSAQFQLDQCLEKNKDKAPCGHDMPGHGRKRYGGCNHYDYTCQADKHRLRDCPENKYGQSCEHKLNGILNLRQLRTLNLSSPWMRYLLS